MIEEPMVKAEKARGWFTQMELFIVHWIDPSEGLTYSTQASSSSPPASDFSALDHLWSSPLHFYESAQC